MTIGRNDPCPCGSGKKAKKCCGAADDTGDSGFRNPLPFAGAHAARAADDAAPIDPEATARPVRPHTDADRNSAIRKLQKYSDHRQFDDDRSAALTMFVGKVTQIVSQETFVELFTDDVQVNFNLLTFLLFDWIMPCGDTVVDRFLKGGQAKVSSGERNYLQSMGESSLRLYQVLDVVLAGDTERIRIHDLWSDEECRVSGDLDIMGFGPGDLIAARTLPLSESEFKFEADIYMFNDEDRSDLLTSLQLSLAAARAATEIQMKESFIFKAIGGSIFGPVWLAGLLPRGIRDGTQTPAAIPQILISDGETLEFGRGWFDVTDVTALISALDRCPELESTDGITWLWMPPDDLASNRHGDEVTTGDAVLGAFVVSGPQLIIETLSRDRMKRARALLRKLGVPGVKHRSTRYDKPELEGDMMTPPATPHEPAPEVVVDEAELQAIQRRFLENHYRQWADDSIPALAGRTPREVVALKTDRHLVVDLLRDFESMEARRTDQPAYDFEPVWRDLGLLDER